MAPAAGHNRNTSSNSSTASRKRQNGLCRPNRPAPLTRRVTPAKAVKATESQDSTERSDSEGYEPVDEPMSFQQFCASCEKQIVAAGSSVLYCSERCRKSDAAQSPSYPLFKVDLTPPPSPNRPMSTHTQHGQSIVPQRNPATSTYFSLNVNGQEVPAETSNAYQHADGGETNQQQQGTESEAVKYLQQFHPSGTTFGGRRHHRISSTASTSSQHMPSLSNTPASSGSGFAPFTPTSTSPATSRRGGHAQTRSNPRWSSSTSFSSRSIDLVTPVTHFPTAPSSLTTLKEVKSPPEQSSVETVQHAPLSYEKMTADMLSRTSSPGASSLRGLFASPETRLEGSDGHDTN